MTALSSLRENISARISQAIAKRSQLWLQVEELRNEIKLEQAQTQISSYQTAIQNPRVDYDLRLIQQLIAYTESLDDKTAYFQTANETLSFLIERVQDDLLIIQTLYDMEVDDLIDQINRRLEEFSTEVQKPLIHVDNIQMTKRERIWEEINGDGAQP